MTDSLPPIAADYTRTGSTRRTAWLILGVGLVAAAAVMPFDGAVASFCRRLQDGGDLALGGDLRRTLQFLQQFGDLASSLVVGLAIFLAAPHLRRRLLDWLVAALAVAAVSHVLKSVVGRPRPWVLHSGHALPGYDSPWCFTGPLGTYPLPRVGPDGAVSHVWRHAWEFWGGIGSHLASMPSSHTSAAGAMAAALAGLFPRLAPLVYALVAVVSVTRVVFGAHYPSDVVAGAALGLALGITAMDSRWGQRLLARAPAPA